MAEVGKPPRGGSDSIVYNLNEVSPWPWCREPVMVENLDPRSGRSRWPLWLTALGMLLLGIMFTIEFDPVGRWQIPFYIGIGLLLVGSLATGLALQEATSHDLFGRALAIAIVVPTAVFALISGSCWEKDRSAGSAMLTEEMYRKGLFMNETQNDTEGDPAPATLKALTINSAYSFTVNQTWNSDEFGKSVCGPSTEDPQPRESRDVQGWGQPDLSVYDQMGPNTYVINETTYLDSGDTMNYTVHLPDWVDGLAVTLAWTDLPGTPLTNTQPIAKLTNLTKNQRSPTSPSTDNSSTT